MVQLSLFYAVVGEPGTASGVKIDDSAQVWELKEAIAPKLPDRLKCTPAGLRLFLGKSVDGAWLESDSEDVKKLKEGEKTVALEALTSKKKELQGEFGLQDVLTGMPKPSTNQIHLLVLLPTTLYIGVDEQYAETISSYMKIADRLKDSEEVKSLLKIITEVSVERTAPTPFIVLENSSGTGKTQMAFNLQAREECDVFYIVCGEPGDRQQRVYSAYAERMKAFQACVRSDLEALKIGRLGDQVSLGAVGQILANRTLASYGFILAALRGSDICIEAAQRSDVIDELNARKERGAKPFVFFLDEFPRAGRTKTHLPDRDQRILENSLRTMRNVFRSFGLAVVVSSTNGTARNLLTTSDRSRDSGPCLWCVVCPSFPRVVLNGDSGIPPLLMEIIKHSRPLFAEIALKYVQDNPYSGSRDPNDSYNYLNVMAGALALQFSALKRRTDEFNTGQLCLLLCTSYRVQDDKVNTIDGHFARLLEQSAFALQIGTDGGLLEGNDPWTCRCVMPSPKEDILLHLTMTGGPFFRPFDQPLCRVLLTIQPSFHYDNTGQRSNDGMRLEALTAAAIVLASHAGGFGGVAFPTFLCELLFELGVCERGVMMERLLQDNSIARWATLVVPFLSPPNEKWPEWLNNCLTSLGNLLRTRNEDRIDFQTNLISGECKDYSNDLDIRVIKSILTRIPADSAIHLIVTNTLQNQYFTAEPWEAFAREQGLQNVDFYRISKGSTLQEIGGLTNLSSTATKLVIFIERG